MEQIRLVTWNVNSVNRRLPLIGAFCREHRPDILCLQELRAGADAFPDAELAALGFPWRLARTEKGRNGVAILSTIPAGTAETLDWGGTGQARHQSCILPGGVQLHNVYVPAGGDVPDPATNRKFADKLAFLGDMRDCLGRRRGAAGIVAGDLNIAPLPRDVWSHRQLLGTVSHTPVETELLEAVRVAGDLVDAPRLVRPPPERLYSWWSYRARDWRQSDRGRRLDHIWVDRSLSHLVLGTTFHTGYRGAENPSDHVPVEIVLSRRLLEPGTR